jgi:hypothetical protein
MEGVKSPHTRLLGDGRGKLAGLGVKLDDGEGPHVNVECSAHRGELPALKQAGEIAANLDEGVPSRDELGVASKQQSGML